MVELNAEEVARLVEEIVLDAQETLAVCNITIEPSGGNDTVRTWLETVHRKIGRALELLRGIDAAAFPHVPLEQRFLDEYLRVAIPPVASGATRLAIACKLRALASEIESGAKGA